MKKLWFTFNISALFYGLVSGLLLVAGCGPQNSSTNVKVVAPEISQFQKQIENLRPDEKTVLSEKTDLDETAFIPLHYDVSLDLSHADTEDFHGTVKIKIKNQDLTHQKPLRLHIQKDLQIIEITVNGLPVSYERGFASLQIAAAKIYTGQFTLIIKYRGSHPRDGLHFIKIGGQVVQAWTHGEPTSARFWLPSFDQPKFKATANFHITVVKNWNALSNGSLKSDLIHRNRENNNEELRTINWQERAPLPTYLYSVLTGELKVQEMKSITPLSVWYPSQINSAEFMTNNIKSGFKCLPQMLEFYSNLFGPYNFEKLAVGIAYDFAGGMENASAITYSSMNFSGNSSGSFSGRDGFDAAILAHEVVHQWFGDTVSPKDWKDLWLNEGFADYFDAAFWETAQGREKFHERMDEYKVRYLANDYAVGASGIQNGILGPIINPKTLPSQMFGKSATLAYEKGALVLQNLKFFLGEQRFNQGLRYYLQKFKFRSVNSQDLKTALEESTHENLDVFWNQWIHRAGLPEFNYTWSTEANHSGFDDFGNGILNITVTQTQPVANGFYESPITIQIVYPSRTEFKQVDLKARKDNIFKFDINELPLTVLLDPDHLVLSKVSGVKARNEWLLMATTSKNFLTRIDGIEGLGESLNLDVVKSIFTHESNEYVKSKALLALISQAQKIPSLEIKNILIESLNANGDHLRTAAAQYIGHMEASVALPLFEDRLIEIYESDPAVLASLQAGNSLVAIESPKAKKVFLQTLYQEPRRNYQLLAVAVIGSGVLQNKGAIPQLEKLFKEDFSPAHFMKTITAGMLAMLKDKAAVHMIAEAMIQEEQPDLNLSYIRSLKSFKEKAALPYLYEMATDPHRPMQVQEAAKAAAGIISSANVP